MAAIIKAVAASYNNEAAKEILSNVFEVVSVALACMSIISLFQLA